MAPLFSGAEPFVHFRYKASRGTTVKLFGIKTIGPDSDLYKSD